MVENTEQTERAAYWNHVNLLADVISDEMGDFPDEVYELIWEEVDGSEYVIYTNKALQVLQYSEEGPYGWYDLVDCSEGWEAVITTMAFTALEGDVREELRDRDALE